VSAPSKAVSNVQQILGAVTQRVLVLEGPLDKTIYTKWFQKLAAPGTLFTSKVSLIDVGGKKDALAVLEWFRDHGGNPGRLFGLVDRDEWDAATIAFKTQALPQLRVNGDRHSIESYFCDPTEIGWALSQQQLAALQAQVLAALPERVDHWALFSVTERVKERLIAAEYPGIFHNQYQLPPDPEIRQRLQTWASILDPNAVFAEFDQLRAAAHGLGVQEQCRRAVWAKDFYEQIVYAGANGLQSVQGKSLNDWMIDLADNAPGVPADIAALLQPLLV
jgi:hypothetical protein